MSFLRDNIGIIFFLFFNEFAISNATCKVIFFSKVPNEPIAPGSFPP